MNEKQQTNKQTKEIAMSISVADRQIIEDVVNNFVNNKWQFTAYNITTVAKQRGANDRHRNLKQAVHDMFANGEMDGYTRDLVTIQVANTKAYLYSPVNADVSDYDEEDSHETEMDEEDSDDYTSAIGDLDDSDAGDSNSVIV